jgi:hypothetical protein
LRKKAFKVGEAFSEIDKAVKFFDFKKLGKEKINA